ncbi:MAG: hypothetical protein ACXWCY_19885 [Burkholderiales bacterium]
MIIARSRSVRDVVRHGIATARGLAMTAKRFGFLIAALVVCAAHAQNYPARPVRLVMPFPPGGNVDTLGRVLARNLVLSRIKELLRN